MTDKLLVDLNRLFGVSWLSNFGIAEMSNLEANLEDKASQLGRRRRLALSLPN
jgi:hypothetical protein